MIKRLRKKFILTNMLLVALVLIIVFGALVGYNYQRLVRQSEEAMRTALKWSDDAPPPVFQFGASHEEEMEEQGEERRFTMVPVFVVLLDEDGGPAQVTGGNNVEVSDQVVAQAVAAATEESGAISGLNLRYLQDTDREGNSRIAFADMGWETDSLWPLIRSSLLVGALALGGFFVISLMLSGLALKPAEEAWEQQRRFVADASHELKTPLTVILTNTGILLAHSGDTIAQQQKWVEYIRDEAQRMRALVEDLLFLAKSDAGKETAPVTAPVDVSELTWSALLPFEPVAFEQGVEMESEIADQLTVQGNADQLRRLVAILLDNAIAYTPPGGEIKLSAAKRRGGIALIVSDNGPGIPGALRERVFERFYRVDTSRSKKEHYGLGLSIAREIASLHRGKLTLRDTPGGGATFILYLPCGVQ